jgi:ribosomal protein S18 acetylase RimI-like enzyme
VAYFLGIANRYEVPIKNVGADKTLGDLTATWLGKNGLYLEDLYISQKHRKLGAGKTLIKHLANLAVQNKCGRFEWCVLDWNTTAINFYKSIGAIAQDEWTIYRLSGENLVSFAQS